MLPVLACFLLLAALTNGEIRMVSPSISSASARSLQTGRYHQPYYLVWRQVLTTTFPCDSASNTVTVKCLDGGTLALYSSHSSVTCSSDSHDTMECSSDNIDESLTVKYECHGTSMSQAYTHIVLHETAITCDRPAEEITIIGYNAIRVGAHCYGEEDYSFSDSYSVCDEGDKETGVDSDLHTCYETLLCQNEADCNATIQATGIGSSSNIESCMTFSVQSNEFASDAPSDAPSMVPSISPSATHSDYPSLVPSAWKDLEEEPGNSDNIPTDDEVAPEEVELPSDFPSLVPSTIPSSTPTDTEDLTEDGSTGPNDGAGETDSGAADEDEGTGTGGGGHLSTIDSVEDEGLPKARETSTGIRSRPSSLAAWITVGAASAMLLVEVLLVPLGF